MDIEKGIRFECQGSGNCCVSRGTYGFVYLSKKDIKELSDRFKITEKNFVRTTSRMLSFFLKISQFFSIPDAIFLIFAFFILDGEPCRIRTCDPFLKRELLYQLS